MIRLALWSVVLVLSPEAASAQVAQVGTEAEARSTLEQRAADIVAALRGNATYIEVFGDAFVAQIPEAQFHAIREQIEGQFGALVGLDKVEATSPTSARIVIRFERGLAAGLLQLEPEAPYRVEGYRITGIEPVNDSAEALLADVRMLPGEASLLVAGLDGEAPLLSHNADVALGIGSTFKLYVLSALARSIEAGEHSWDEVVPLTARSYPSGLTQSWPQGAPVTLQTLATLMISISDNTATDQLIALLGREAIEAEVAAAGHADAARMYPFMTTREMFLLKSAGAEGIEAYRTMDLDARRAQLASLAGVERTEAEVIAAFTGGPNAIDIEWMASATDIANVLRRIRALDDPTALEILAVSPSIPESSRGQWRYAGYKGGSEPGVLNLSWLLQDAAGQWRVVTLGWNDPAANLDQQRLETLALRAIALARGE